MDRLLTQWLVIYRSTADVLLRTEQVLRNQMYLQIISPHGCDLLQCLSACLREITKHKGKRYYGEGSVDTEHARGAGEMQERKKADRHKQAGHP